MTVLSMIRAFAEGVARGFALFLTSRHNYVEQVSIPRLDSGRSR